jgi:hypothetical protein
MTRKNWTMDVNFRRPRGEWRSQVIRINYDATPEEMGPAEIKEANRLMWAVKGMLIPEGYSSQDINSVLRGYYKRLWGKAQPYMFEGFEEAWKIKCK